MLALAAVLALCAPARAQVDPDRRRLIQVGYDQPMSGPGPTGAYLFFYSNEPHFVRKDLTLRTALAPVYADNELGIRHVFGTRNDLGIGLAGGGFAEGYSEVRQGHYYREESFTGHGASASLSLYRDLLSPDAKIPLNLVLRGGMYGAFYRRNSDTAPDFKRPPDHWDYRMRAGLRLGGEPPKLLPGRAAELSVWYQGYWRDRGAGYGYDSDRQLVRTSHLYWTRALISYRLKSRKQFEASAEAGSSINADRLDAYRLGGLLPFASEFPLSLPGYYNGELSARRYVLFGGQYAFPLGPDDVFGARLFADFANVTYLPGLGQPGPWNEGVGTGLDFNSPGGIWKVMLNYAYGVSAIRSGGRGAHSVSLLTQFDFMALRSHERKRGLKTPPPSKPEGLDWLWRVFRP